MWFLCAAGMTGFSSDALLTHWHYASIIELIRRQRINFAICRDDTKIGFAVLYPLRHWVDAGARGEDRERWGQRRWWTHNGCDMNQQRCKFWHHQHVNLTSLHAYIFYIDSSFLRLPINKPNKNPLNFLFSKFTVYHRHWRSRRRKVPVFNFLDCSIWRFFVIV